MRAGSLANKQYAGTVQLSLIFMSFENQNEKYDFREAVSVQLKVKIKF